MSIIKKLKQVLFKKEKNKTSRQNTLSDYVGVPAPAYLKEDEWFGPPPEYTEKQKEYIVGEVESKRKEFENTLSIESHDIHQKIYEIATKSKNTTLDLDSPGGSENFQSDPGKWNSGNGWGKF
jgi:hypothetical protein|tara:strand:- start:3614 stop:3982 length:369 start_codon:yes stop_codon:yes gene_type:complete